MKHLYDDGVKIHLCDGSQIFPDIYLAWTRCERDVPANKSFMSNEAVTCKECLEEAKDAN